MMQETLLWTERLFAISVLIQSLEQLSLNFAFGPRGAWSWKNLKSEFPPGFLSELIFAKIVSHPLFSVFRIGGCLLLWISPSALVSGFLFLSSLLLIMRWRGNFNGGSDHLTLITGAGLTLAHCFPGSQIASACLLYIGLQAVMSYFIGGWVKIKKANWRSGKALQVFMRLSSYQASPTLIWLQNKSNLIQILALAGIIFELSAPIALVYLPYLWPFLTMAFAFHLLNFSIFGFNRFVFTWLAAYPSLIFTAHFISSNF